MPVDIVVTNYHTPEDLEQFLDSLEKYPPRIDATLTIVEVDAGEDYVHDFTWGDDRPGRTIGTALNIGYARACNHAAFTSTGNVLAFFNADIVLAPRAIDECVAALQSERQWAILGPRQVDRAGLIRHAGIFGTRAAPAHRGWNERDRGQYNDVREAVTVSGSAYFIKRDAWNALTDCPLYRDIAPDVEGAFLPTAHYYEETFCSYHAATHGYKIVYFGPTQIIHQWHRASTIGGWADKQMPVSREYFRAACEHHSIPHD